MSLYWHWLMNLEKITLKAKRGLMDRFNSPEIIYHLSRETLLQTKLLKAASIDFIFSRKNLEHAKKTMEYLDAQKIKLVTSEDVLYPKILNTLYAPPIALYAKGHLRLLKNLNSIAMVGSRNPDLQGINYANEFARALSFLGFTIISGLAAGIDASSHEGSLDGLGGTIAVLGTGIDQCYPRANRRLFDRIAEEGLILSEFSLGEKPLPYHFPLRNRIISGLSQGVLIIEARRKSGSLITANHALDQGKNVYVIPGDIKNAHWEGGNQLLKEGAKLVTEVSDIVEDYVISPPKEIKSLRTSPPKKKLEFNNTMEKDCYLLIEKGYKTIDEIVAVSGFLTHEVNSSLTMMELQEMIEVRYGNIMLI